MPDSAARWVIQLPWLRPPLSANDRWPHRAVEYRVQQEVKTAAWALAKAKKLPRLHAILIELVWYPADNRRRDGDNIAPTLKYLTDGLVAAKVLPDDNSERVLKSSTRVVIARNDPYDSGKPRLMLVITDASALAPLEDYAPQGS